MKLIPILGLICLFGCSTEPQPPAGCTFCKALPSESFNTLALRTLGDPERGPELAALNRVDDRVRPSEIERLIGKLERLSEQEAIDQVYRRLVLYLCGPCYRQWIEKPTG